MTGKDSLKDLIKSCIGKHLTSYPDDWYSEYEIDYGTIADHLLANGVIVPPCKVGDTIYTIGGITGIVYGNVVETISYDVDGLYLQFAGTGMAYASECFLTREEAEQALKERSEHS